MAEPLATAQRWLLQAASVTGDHRLESAEHTTTDAVREAAVQPPFRFESGVSGDVLAPLPLAMSLRPAGRPALSSQRGGDTATLPRPARRGVEPLQRTMGSTERMGAAWGPSHRHGLSRSIDGQRVQWTAGRREGSATVLGGVAIAADAFTSAAIAEVVGRSEGGAPPAQPSTGVPPMVAPPIHRATVADHDGAPAAARSDRPTMERAVAQRVLDRTMPTEQDQIHRGEAPRSTTERATTQLATAQRATTEWVSTERVVAAERLLRPARTAPPLALDGTLQRALAGSDELAAALGELVVSSPMAHDAARTTEARPAPAPTHATPTTPAIALGPVPVTAAALAQAMITTAKATTAQAGPANATMAQVGGAQTSVAPSPVARSTTTRPARSTVDQLARSQAAPSPASTPDQRWVPARPGTLFSRLAGVSLLQRSPLHQPSAAMTARRLGNDSAVTAPTNDPVPLGLDVLPLAAPVQPTKRAKRGTRSKPANGVAGGVTPDDAAVIAGETSTEQHSPVRRSPMTAPMAAEQDAPAPRSALPVPAAELADRFLAELARHRQERPKPLPTQFASIAEMIVGNRSAKISTGEASQRALASVNKVAATTGDVIHLAQPPRLTTANAELTGIIAHELTHVAAPSPAPRFFDDDRHSAEERRASEIGEIMRRSPAPPPSGSIATRGGTTSMSIAEQHTRPAITRTARDDSGMLRRAMDAPSATPTRGQSSPDRNGSSSSSSSTNEYPSSSNTEPAISAQEFSSMLREHFDIIVEMLEDRIGSDIERRGGRYRGDF